MAKSPPAGVHPIRVFLASTPTEADLVVGFFEEKGVRAWVEDPLTRQAFAGCDLRIDEKRGVGVVVSSADEARALSALAEYRARPALGDEERVEEEESR